VKPHPSHFDIVNNEIQRVPMELGPSEKGSFAATRRRKSYDE
jgi:hypothetical protein